jgi:hypothetical protein
MMYRWVSPLILLVIGVSIVSAQPTTCPALVNQAITVANENCTDLARNEVCYGHRSLRATFYDALPVADFDEPSERVALTHLQRIQTAPPSVEADEVGVAIMKLQAMLPNTLPGQSVVFVMVGDVDVEDSTGTEAAAPTDPLSLILPADADVYTGPGFDYAVAATIDAGTIIEIDGTTVDRDWYRALLDESLVWMPAAALPPGEQLATLTPVRGIYGPMQAFTLTAGLGIPGCEEAPSRLLVQGPEAVEVTLNVNGVDVTIGSTVVFEATTPDELEVAVIDGSAQLSDAQIVLGGFRARIAINPQTRRAIGTWAPTEPIPPQRLERLRRLEQLDPRILNYAVAAPRAEQIRERINNGELAIQNNFGTLTPNQRASYRAFERKLATQITLRNQPGVRARLQERIAEADTPAERARLREQIETQLGAAAVERLENRERSAVGRCDNASGTITGALCATDTPSRDSSDTSSTGAEGSTAGDDITIGSGSTSDDASNSTGGTVSSSPRDENRDDDDDRNSTVGSSSGSDGSSTDSSDATSGDNDGASGSSGGGALGGSPGGDNRVADDTR